MKTTEQLIKDKSTRQLKKIVQELDDHIEDGGSYSTSDLKYQQACIEELDRRDNHDHKASGEHACNGCPDSK
jgi:hypothetical protein